MDHESAGRSVGQDGSGRVDRSGNGVADAQKNEIKPWLKQQWVIPPRANSAFVANMEDVLDIYARAHDSRRPVVCVDEGGKQLIGDIREPLPVRPGCVARQDSENRRGGVANLFMAFEPPVGRRHVEVTERKRSVGFAHFLRTVSDKLCQNAETIVLVCDNLSTHSPAAFYEAFEPSEARRLTERFEWHYTPKHGSWLNVAEMELSVLARQCLDRRIPDSPTLAREIAFWKRRRNAAEVVVHWQFTTTDARVKLRRPYPTIPMQ